MLIASPATGPRPNVTPAGTLWYDRPGERWFEALPIGNGRLGGMVYGGVPTERIDLSESTAWSGGPSTVDLSPTARQELPAIRKLLLAGDYAQAQRLAGEHLLGTRASFGTNLPLPHVRLTFADRGPATSYRRSLDLDQGIVAVTYEQGGTRFTREVLASHPQRVIAVRIGADRPGRSASRSAWTGRSFLAGRPARRPASRSAVVPSSPCTATAVRARRSRSGSPSRLSVGPYDEPTMRSWSTAPTSPY